MLFTPGPTAVPPEVRDIMAQPQPNPDLDPTFGETYAQLTADLQTVYNTDHDIVVLGGEGILGLEAAVASIVEPGDRVLCISNGRYGDGFADFVTAYGGEPTLISAPYDSGYDLDAIENAVAAAAADGAPFTAATMVHCETPTGTLNDLTPVLELLKEHTILSIVDAVSSVGGTPVPTDRIDICLGGSQKCFSAPPGLTTAAISDHAWEQMEKRNPTSLYTNFLPWKDVSEGFPYTHLDVLVSALAVAVDRIVTEGVENVYDRHTEAADRCRERGSELRLPLYPDTERSSPTVTAFYLPGNATSIQKEVAESEEIVLATGLGELEDDILRIGHMGYNADVSKVDQVMDAIANIIE
ncbi:pyridoxal-phosphate-dependent aminotransferase family protein [Natronocalculus amylovorans]|uniref:Alanine--glyoxylate aminotransferase family protein n=1 Tax=Natronocalculus amylovorans TaxID=2917812 RepID=A0AAE3FZY3_9EURY|nr:alanine--glyoxylate aminotransferase family protein [Natronocalculus amylovorans]MCL9818482.1 alanine--glyoxylate aminotransferase family protein [Natronocalculus amylovorans]